MNTTQLSTALLTVMLLSLVALGGPVGCAVVQQNEVGVRRTNGRLREPVLEPGRYYTGLLTQMLKLPVEIINLEIQIDLPSREGLSVNSDISILYRIEPSKAHTVLREAGSNYEDTLILSSFRSAAADVTAKFMAKDMHSGARSEIEAQIAERMGELLNERGFIIEAVLMKSVRLPVGLSRAIEDRLSAEQDAMRMQFVLEQERSEAERKLIEAQGQRDANKVLSEGLTPNILKLRALETFLMLSDSPNAKVIITDSDSPLQMSLEEQSSQSPPYVPPAPLEPAAPSSF